MILLSLFVGACLFLIAFMLVLFLEVEKEKR